MGISSTSTEIGTARKSEIWPAFRGVRRFVGFYFFISAATMVGVYFFRNHHDLVTGPVWIRGIAVLATSLLLMMFSARASRGSSRGYLRLRICSVILLIAVVVIILLPGDFPTWMKLEQALCGLMLLGVVVSVNSKRIRALYGA
jgi:hypothetical protein